MEQKTMIRFPDSRRQQDPYDHSSKSFRLQAIANRVSYVKTNFSGDNS